MTKIVINEEQGGFQLSQKAIQKLIDEHGYEKTRVNEDGEYENPDAEIVSDEGVFEDKDVTEAYLMNTFVDSVRADPSLVQVVEELGFSKASGRLSQLKAFDEHFLSFLIELGFEAFDSFVTAFDLCFELGFVGVVDGIFYRVFEVLDAVCFCFNHFDSVCPFVCNQQCVVCDCG